MDVLNLSDHPTPSGVVVASDLAREIPVIDEVISTKIEKLDKHGSIDDLEDPPSKRIKSSPSKDVVELDRTVTSTQPVEGAVIRDRQKGVAPIKAEFALF